jgi:hypothetical protein
MRVWETSHQAKTDAPQREVLTARGAISAEMVPLAYACRKSVPSIKARLRLSIPARLSPYNYLV